MMELSNQSQPYLDLDHLSNPVDKVTDWQRQTVEEKLPEIPGKYGLSQTMAARD